MTDNSAQSCQPNIVERLRSSEPLPACPFDRISPHYLTMPADKPCPFCGQENTLDGPDKCRGADTRIMGEAADHIDRLTHLCEAYQGQVEAGAARIAELEKDFEIVRAASRLFEDASNTWMERALKAEAALAINSQGDTK